MNSKLHLFENMEFGSIRAMEIDGQPWFVGKDVAKAMGYSNASKAVMSNVEDEDKMEEMIPHSPGGNLVSKTTIINESGLYSLIISCNLPTARKFKHWVTSEVLPSIRQHGAYIEEQKLRELLGEAEAANRLFQKLLKKTIEQNKQLTDDMDAIVEKVEELLPKAAYYDDILQSPDLLPVSVIAKDYNMSAIAFNKMLHKLRIQYQVDGTWLLYQQYCNQGFTKSRTYHVNAETVRVHTLWTQHGRRFLNDILSTHGIFSHTEEPQTVLLQ